MFKIAYINQLCTKQLLKLQTSLSQYLVIVEIFLALRTKLGYALN